MGILPMRCIPVRTKARAEAKRRQPAARQPRRGERSEATGGIQQPRASVRAALGLGKNVEHCPEWAAFQNVMNFRQTEWWGEENR
jgi:hypothetical protein